MKIEQSQLDKVEAKLNKQNALLAVLGAAFWTIPFIISWYFVYLYNPKFSPIMLLLSGFLVGIVVRIHGKGLTGIFSLIAILFHTCIVIVAFSLNIVLEGTTWALLLFGLYVAGVLAAKKISRIEVSFEEHRAYTKLTSPESHVSSKKLKNTWLIILPILLIMLVLTSYLAMVSVMFFSEYKTFLLQEKQSNQQRQHIKNKEIDILPEALDKRTTHDILLYSYAYHSGLLFRKLGRGSGVFPRSEYKAIALLKYLVETRDNSRAKFILGLLTGEVKGHALIQAAADQNDKYAHIYLAVHFGCYSDEHLAIELLKKLNQTASEEYIQQEISSILYLGFKEACVDIEQSDFSLRYVRNYKEY
jgi:hypothetical protein